jgi:ankyrin repeat protein
LNNHKTVIQLLLANGAELEWVDEQKCTPLHLACKRGHVELLGLLLTSGANIYAYDMSQWNALHYGAYNGFKKVCNLLLKWKADNDKLRDMKNSQEKKPIHICKNPET